MKTAKEYIERMQSDKAFFAQMGEKVKAAKDAGAEDLFAAASAAAKELGYEISPEQVKEITGQSEDISEEDLGKVAGGTSCLGLMTPILMSTVSATIGISAIFD